MKSICIVQIENVHAEVVIPQLEALEDYYDLSLYIPRCFYGLEELEKYRLKSKYFSPFSENPKKYLARSESSSFLRMAHYILALLRLLFLCMSGKFDLLVFNTIPTIFKGRLICFLFAKVKKIQIVHNLAKTNTFLVSRFDKTLVLSKEVRDYAEKEYSYRCDTSELYFFDKFFQKIQCDDEVKKNDSRKTKIKIGVIGKTDYLRRNYRDLIDSLQKNENYREYFTVYIIGETDPRSIRDFKQFGDELVIFHEGFLSFEKLLCLVNEMDLIAYLIDPEVPDFNLYNKVKISGTSNLCLYFNKPVLIQENYPIEEKLAKRAVFYKKSVGEFFDAILDRRIDKADFGKNCLSESEWKNQYAHDTGHYLSLIEDAIGNDK